MSACGTCDEPCYVEEFHEPANCLEGNDRVCDRIIPDEKLLAEMKKTSEVNEVDTAAFRKASLPLYDEVGAQAGKDMMEMVLSAVQ